MDVLTAGILNLFGPTLCQINSPTGAGFLTTAISVAEGRGLKILPAVPIGTNDFEDNSKTPPEFDKEAARKGEKGFTTGGLREKTPLPVSTIVSTLVTNEPFVGHAQYDPSTAPNWKVRTKGPQKGY